MNEQENFWLRLWQSIIAAVVLIVMASATSCQVSNYRISKMVEAGVDPISARCAVTISDAGANEFCIANQLAIEAKQD